MGSACAIDTATQQVVSNATITILVAAKAVKEALTKYLIRGRSELDQNVMRAERKEVEDVIGLPRYYRIEEETTERNRVN